MVLSFNKRCCESCGFPKEFETLLRGTILRLRKKRKQQPFSSNTSSLRLDETELLTFFRDELGPEYVSFPLILVVDNGELARLVSSKGVQIALLHVPDDFLHRVYKLVMEMNGRIRPESRSKEMLEFSGLASIHFDHSLVNDVNSLKGSDKLVPSTLCVEIKPKSGVFPSDLDSNTCCRYCAQKALRSYIPVSSYCPMDLYSKNVKKIKRAIEALVDSPQNNLRVFLDGIPIYTQEILNDGSSILCGRDWLQECLSIIIRKDMQDTDTMIRPLPQFDFIYPITEIDLINAVTHTLSIDPILDRLLSIQLEGTRQGGVTRATEFLHTLTSSNSISSSSLSLPPDVQAILKTVTANDCSLLITFSIESITDEARVSHYISPDYSISVIDLDSKPLEKAPTWLASEIAAKEAFQKRGVELGIQCRYNN